VGNLPAEAKEEACVDGGPQQPHRRLGPPRTPAVLATITLPTVPEDDVEFLDSYAREQGMDSRSAALHKAVGLLRTAQLAGAYEDAWDSWAGSGDAQAWDAVAADGLGD
jgi:hypothetical protein